MNDIYLAGYADTVWRDKFKTQISDDIQVFDPFNPEYEKLQSEGRAELVAKEFEKMENSNVIVFYICKEWISLYGMLQLGFAVGRNKQVIIYLENDVESEEKVRRFCEYTGLVIVDSMDDLIENAEESVGQIALCDSLDM